MWVGARGKDRSFYWRDGTPANAYWYTGEPNDHEGQEDCAEFYFDLYAMNDEECSDTNAYVCQGKHIPPTLDLHSVSSKFTTRITLKRTVSSVDSK